MGISVKDFFTPLRSISTTDFIPYPLCNAVMEKETVPIANAAKTDMFLERQNISENKKNKTDIRKSM